MADAATAELIVGLPDDSMEAIFVKIPITAMAALTELQLYPDGNHTFFIQVARNPAINIASATLPDICVELNARKTLPDWKSDGNLTG